MAGEIAIAAGSGLAARAGMDGLLADFARYLDVRPESMRAYVNGAKAFLRFIKEQGLEPTREAVIAFREAMKRSRRASTAQLYMSGVRRFFGWLADTGRIASNPAAGVKGVKQGRGFRRDCLTAAQARELLESIDQSSTAGKRDYALLALMAGCGLRDCEAARARIGDLRTVCGQSALAVHGKGRDGADELVHLAPQIERALRRYLAERGEANPGAPLFASASNRNANGAPLTTRSISRIAKERLRAIGLDSERLTAHSLRHTAATLNLLAGGTLEETQRLLRHSSITTTQVYAHHLEWAERRAEARIAGALFAQGI